MAVDGTITVAGIIPPATITYEKIGDQFILSWPEGLGWRLQTQTNARSIGLRTNWVDVAGGTSSPFTNVINRTNGTVFYRLIHP